MTTHLQRLRALGLTAERFAVLAGVHPVTVRSWGRPRANRPTNPVPAWVWLLIEAWERCPGLIPVSPPPNHPRPAPQRHPTQRAGLSAAIRWGNARADGVGCHSALSRAGIVQT